MIIQCQNCSRKFIVKDQDIPKEGRDVQCGYCSVTWHQMPLSISSKTIKQVSKKALSTKSSESLSVDSIKASDGKTYKFLGSQWAQLLPSGKTGLFAKKKIGRELDKLTGRKIENFSEKKKKKPKKEMDPSLSALESEKKLPDVYKSQKGLGFFGYLFLIIIIGFSIIGILRTFENDLLTTFPETKFIYNFLDVQLEYFAETVKNMIAAVDTSKGPEAAETTLKKLAERLARLEGNGGSLSSENQKRLGILAEQIATIEAKVPTTLNADGSAKARAFLLAVGQLRTAVRAGRPFSNELEILGKLKSEDEALKAIVALFEARFHELE